MRYFGSKTSLVPAIHRVVSRYATDGTFCDPFGGLGIVGSYFKARGYGVFSGDVLRFAHDFQVARLEFDRPPRFSRLCRFLRVDGTTGIVQRLEAAPARPGWFFREFSERRRFFTKENASKIEAAWRLIVSWDQAGLISPRQRSVLMASLIDSMDKVANTAGTYYAHLKIWHRKAMKPFRFSFVAPVPGSRTASATLCDAEKLVGERTYDILYLDPPYNERSYAHYYHLPETLAGGRSKAIRGRSGIPRLPLPSRFNRPGFASDAIESLMSRARCKVLVFHYASTGLIPLHRIRKALTRFRRLDAYYLNAPGYTTSRRPRQTRHVLYVASNV